MAPRSLATPLPPTTVPPRPLPPPPQVAKIITKLGFAAAFVDFKIQNIVSTGDCGFPIRLEGLADVHHRWSSVRPVGKVEAWGCMS